MIELPSRVRVLGLDYTVEQFAHVISDDGDGLLHADVDHNKLIIRIATEGFPQAMLAETLIHESLHAIFNKAGFETGGREHEDMVNRLSPVVMLWLRENPKLLDYALVRVNDQEVPA